MKKLWLFLLIWLSVGCLVGFDTTGAGGIAVIPDDSITSSKLAQYGAGFELGQRGIVSVNFDGEMQLSTISTNDISNQLINTDHIQLESRTLEEFDNITPGRAGLMLYCSDCTTDGIVISTGTTKGAFGRISARTTPIS